MQLCTPPRLQVRRHRQQQQLLHPLVARDLLLLALLGSAEAHRLPIRRPAPRSALLRPDPAGPASRDLLCLRSGRSPPPFHVALRHQVGRPLARRSASLEQRTSAALHAHRAVLVACQVSPVDFVKSSTSTRARLVDSPSTSTAFFGITKNAKYPYEPCTTTGAEVREYHNVCDVHLHQDWTDKYRENICTSTSSSESLRTSSTPSR